jgi:hypothetical protein
MRGGIVMARPPRYKRNQIEDAICAIDQGKEPVEAIRTRLKRLLDTDRMSEECREPSDPLKGTFAFFDDAKPGKGMEVTYSAHRAFVLFVGLRLLDAGFPQATVVRLLIKTQHDLRRAHKRPPDLRAKIGMRRAGDIAADGPLLAIFHAPGGAHKIKDAFVQAKIYDDLIHMAEERQRSHSGQAITLLDLGGTGRTLQSALDATRPSKRGRPATTRKQN